MVKNNLIIMWPVVLNMKVVKFKSMPFYWLPVLFLKVKWTCHPSKEVEDKPTEEQKEHILRTAIHLSSPIELCNSV